MPTIDIEYLERQIDSHQRGVGDIRLDTATVVALISGYKTAIGVSQSRGDTIDELKAQVAQLQSKLNGLVDKVDVITEERDLISADAATRLLRCNTLTAERDALAGQVAALAAEIATMKAHTYCAYCGHEAVNDDQSGTAISEHIRTCAKHPMRAVEAERDTLAAQVADLKERLSAVETDWHQLHARFVQFETEKTVEVEQLKVLNDEYRAALEDVHYNFRNYLLNGAHLKPETHATMDKAIGD